MSAVSIESRCLCLRHVLRGVQLCKVQRADKTERLKTHNDKCGVWTLESVVRPSLTVGVSVAVGPRHQAGGWCGVPGTRSLADGGGGDRDRPPGVRVRRPRPGGAGDRGPGWADGAQRNANGRRADVPLVVR